MAPDATILMSGGIDSAACAQFLKDRGSAIRGVFIDYGQAGAALEWTAVRGLAKHLSVPLSTYNVSGTARFSAGESIGRNGFLIFAAVLLSRCHSGLLAIGIHSGTPYFDCSTAFFEMMARVVAEHTDGAVSLIAPFLHWSARLAASRLVARAYRAEIGEPSDASKEALASLQRR